MSGRAAGWALMLALWLTAVTAPGAERVVTLVGDPWPPYITGEFGEEASGGIGVAMMRAIFERVEEADLSVPLVPWNRALRAVEAGHHDGIGVLLKTPERERYMLYTQPLMRSFTSVWYATRRFPEGFDWTSYDDFAPHTVGIIRGHSYEAALDQRLADGTLRVVEVASADQLFAMLRRGRVDLVLADQLVGETYADVDSEAVTLAASDKHIAVSIFHIALSKKSPARHLLPQIDAAIESLRREGVLTRIVGARHAELVETPAPPPTP